MEKVSSRVNGADGFRAIACLLVMYHHAIQRMSIALAPRWVQWLFYVGWRGEVGVSIFFVLSGCLLSVPFWNHFVNGGPKPKLVNYARNRIARVVPGTWLAMIVTTYVGYRVIHYPINWARFFSGMSFIYAFHYKTFFPSEFDGPLWTVGLEAFCYVVLPFILFSIFKFGKSTRGAAIGLFLWIVFLQALQPFIISHFMTGLDGKGWQYGMTGGAKLWMPYWNPISFLSQFLIGSGAALLICVERKHHYLKSWHWDAICFVTGIGAFILICEREIPGTPDAFTKQAYLTPFYPTLIAISLAAAASGGYLYKILDNRFFKHVAQISFGLYLWHWFIITMMQATITKDFTVNGVDDLYRWLGLTVLAYSLAWGVAILSWRYMEKPILNFNRSRIQQKSQIMKVS
jgi:peptidoglycan/LPS O-acetylase OafA/YrhL